MRQAGQPHRPEAATTVGPGPAVTRSTPNVSYPPYAQQPELSDKSKVVAGVLTILLGSLGVGRFYTGHIGIGIAQLLTCGGFGIWSLIDGILFLTSNDRTDAQGRLLRS
ncbi:TM2 domain-containing protein [Kitasatospora sp. RG8]|nr:TM2 domain-containing protein [Kitasatospora sp. RG8]